MRAGRWIAAVAAAAAFAVTAESRGGPKVNSSSSPAAQAARIELGRRLFFDPAASRTGRVSCGSCHDPEHGFTDTAHPSMDELGPAPRRTMPLADLPAGVKMHSDGEFEDLRALLEARLLPLDDLDLDTNPRLRQFAFSSYADVVTPKPALVSVGDRIAEGSLYADGFALAYGDARPTTERVIDALEAYTASLRSGTNPVDRHLAGDEAALLPSQRRGLDLFQGKAACASCHTVKSWEGHAALRDDRFHDVGISWRTARLAGEDNPGRRGDAGLGAHGRRSADRRNGHMQFKTPSLRDVAARGPYMHDGSLATLVDVIDYFDRGGERHPGLDGGMKRLGLTDGEKDDLLAFLLALSSPDRAGLGEAPGWLHRTTTVRLVTPDGRPLADMEVVVEAAGDRFREVPLPRRAPSFITDAQGRVRFPFPPTTHARLRVDGHVVAGGRPIPDFAAEAELIAVPLDVVAVRVIGAGGNLASAIRAQPLPVADELGRVKQNADGGVLDFDLVRALPGGEGVYVARAPKGDVTPRRLLVPRGGNGAMVMSQADLDVKGGGLTYLDMRVVHAPRGPVETR